jgi:HEPN domain-containing protein
MLPLLTKWQRSTPSHQSAQLTLEAFIRDTLGGPTLSGVWQSSGQYPEKRRTEIERAIREAWAWLEGAALLIQDPGGRNSVRHLSRRGQKLASEPNPRRLLSARRLSKDILHPVIREDVWAPYHRGKYDTAVFEAMKAVEVAVRAAAGFTAADIGTKLMRKAFDI